MDHVHLILYVKMSVRNNMWKWLLMLLPGGTILLGLAVATGIGRPPHSATIQDGINIFDKTPYKYQLFKRKHPGKCYDPDNVWPNGDIRIENPKYGKCAKNALRR